jgi:cytochrome c
VEEFLAMKVKVFAIAALIVGLIPALPAIATAQDATNGAQIFKQCMTCHRIGDGAKNLVGPVLNGVIGRQAGTYEGFRYSPLMKTAGENGLVWNEDLIFQYIADPTPFLKKYLTDKGKADLAAGSAFMTFKLADEQQRKDVIAYIKTFSPGK